MLVLFMCLLTWTYIEWCYNPNLKGTDLDFCALWVRCLAHGLTGANVWTHTALRSRDSL